MRNPIRYQRRRGGIAVGCLIAAAVVLVILIAVGVFVALNMKNWAADGLTFIASEGIRQADLPEQEKPELIAIIEQVRDEFKAGSITIEEMQTVMESLTTSPAIYIGSVMVFDAQYVQRSKLPDAERAAGALALNRYAQGMADGSLQWSDAETVLAPIMTTDANGNKRMKEPSAVTDEEIRAVIADAKAKADELGIPEETAEIDLSDELKNAIEESLGRPLGG